LGTPALRADGFSFGATAVVVGTVVTVVVAGGGGGAVVVVGAGFDGVALGVSAGVVRPVHGVGGPAGLADDAGGVDDVEDAGEPEDEAATTADGTVTVVVVDRGDDLPPVAGLRRASGCSPAVTSGVSSSSLASVVVMLAMVRCGSPNDGPAAWSSCAVSSVVSAIRPANPAMGAITTAAKHPRPLAGSSR
jgi:hypothetical protein